MAGDLCRHDQAVVVDEPRDDELERRLVGAMLLGGAHEALARITPAMFAMGRHRTIVEAVQRLAAAGEPVGADAVAADLRDRGQLEHAGGHEALSDAMHHGVASAVAPTYADQVADLARRRRARAAGEHLRDAALDPQLAVDEAAAEATDRLLADVGDRRGHHRATDYTDELDALRRGGRGRDLVTTGWANVDAVWRPGPARLMLLTGVPGHGKSAWLDHLTVNLAGLHGWRIAMWSPEGAPTEDHIARLMALRAGQRFDQLDETAFADAFDWVDRHFVWVDHDHLDRVDQVLTQVRLLADLSRVDAFVIDPWTQLAVDRDTRMREDEWLNQAVGMVRRFAVRHRLAAFVVVHPHQLKANGDGTYPVPDAGVLHGGSVWRKHADHLLAVWRDQTGKRQREERVDLYVQKIRRNGVDGSMGSVAALWFDPATGAYRPITARQEQPF